MATTKTTQIANAISLLSDVLSAEVAEGNHFLEDEDDSVTAEDHDALREAANDFITTQLSELEDIQMELQGAVDAVTDVDAWNTTDDDEADEDDEYEDDVGNGDVVIDQDNDGDADNNDDDDDDEAEPTDAEKLEILLAAGEELEDKIEELEGDKESLAESLQGALTAIDSLVEDAESYQSELESY